MDKLRPAGELAGLQQYLERLESGYVRLRRNQVDVTKSEIGILKREISHWSAFSVALSRGSKCAFGSN
jgi:hypothetical protein